MVYYLLVVAPSSAPTPSASSGIYERRRSRTTTSRAEGAEEETILDVFEVKGLKIFRAIGAGAGLEDALPIQRTSALLLVAIPSELSLDDLCHFLGHREGLEAVRVVFRNEPRGRFFCPSLEGKSGPGSGGGFYTAILLCRSQAHADALYKANHGKLFSHDSSQDDKGPCCYLAFLEAIVYSSKSWELTRTKSDELQKSSPSDSEMPEAVIPSTAYEVPSCPVCIERIDVSGTGLVTHSHGWSAEHQDAGRPPTCVACAIITATNGGAAQRKNVAGNPVTLQCECCSKQDELWVCLICGHLGCGRYQDAHAKDHATEYRHRFCYQLDTGRIWDYASDVFVHRRLVQHAAMGHFELALPAPAMEESRGSKVPVPGLPGHEQLLSMELDAILASQLDHQRSLYERQLADLQRQQSSSVNDLQSAIEAEGRREAAMTEEMQSHEKQMKVLEKQLASAQKSWSTEQEKLKFAKELNASLLQNRKDMADGEGKESKTEEDALVLRLREKALTLARCRAADETWSPMNTDLGVRKAQFFDRCLRADRSVEYPRRPALPPVKISSFRAQEVKVPNSPKAPWHRASTNENQEPKRSSSNGAAAAGADEAKAKLSRFDTSMLDLVNQCRRVRLHPATTGLVRPDPGKLKLEYGFLTDEWAEAITDSLKATASEVREAHFRSNGLSATGARQLLEALPAELECVNLSQNDLSNDVGWCLAFRHLTKLNSLTLSDCQLADNACVELLNNLIRCKSLTRIDLSRNVISSGSAFQPLLKRFSQLEELDVHWNHFGGEASALLQGIIECHHGGLRSLNLSWNPLGKFCAEENCHQLVRLFRETKTLRHLDLSRCDLTMAHCKILAEGLEDNRTIVGLHVSGNEAHVDAQGFMVPRKNNSPPGEGDPHATMSLADDEDSCCWVCQRWRETKLRYTPGISGPDASDVWAYTSIDGFTKPIRMQRQGEDFVTYVMAAPGPLRFVFQADRHPIACSRTAPQVELREMIAALRGGVGCYQRTNLVPEDGDNGVVLKLRAKQPDDEADRLVEVISFSTIMVVERPEDESVCDHYIPRKLGEFKPSVEPKDWSLECSLFAPHWEPLSGKQFRERCFEVDWHNSHLTSLLPEEGETIAIRDLLREHYAEMKVLFSSLCSVDWFALQRGRPLSFGMGLYQYTHMLVQHNLVGQDLSLEEADAIFVAAGLPAKDTSKYLEAYRTEGRLIHRHGFFGLLVRLAIRFARGNSARGLKGRFNNNKTEQVKKALQYIFAKHLIYPYAPMKNNLRCVQWRESVLHTQTVEGVFRKHMQAVVDPLFKTFAEGRPFLTPEEWFRMLDCMEIFPCSGTELDSDAQQMNAWDRVWAWQASAMTQVEELAHVRSLHLLFVEFLEALARLVGLLHSRKFCENHLEDENGERWDYGMPQCSPVSVFCLEPAVTDTEGFAELLDGFFAGPIPAKALSG